MPNEHLPVRTVSSKMASSHRSMDFEFGENDENGEHSDEDNYVTSRLVTAMRFRDWTKRKNMEKYMERINTGRNNMERKNMERNNLERKNMDIAYADVAQHYSLGAELGEGAAGVVRRCTDRRTGELMACKSVAKNGPGGAVELENVHMEVRALKVVGSHPAVVGLRSVLEDEEHVHIVIDICEGGDLFDRIKVKKKYLEKDAARVCRSLASIVHFCHSKGIMHRDLKPENVLLVSQNSDTDIKLADFGQAVFFTPGVRLTEMVGTLYYIAPEVLNSSYGPEADVWSLGIILYILLSGGPPFYGKKQESTMAKIRSGTLNLENGPWKNISEEAKDLVRQMLCSDPSKRITAEKAKGHPWIRQQCKCDITIPRSNFFLRSDDDDARSSVSTESSVSNRSPLPGFSPSSPWTQSQSQTPTSKSHLFFPTTQRLSPPRLPRHSRLDSSSSFPSTKSCSSPNYTNSHGHSHGHAHENAHDYSHGNTHGTGSAIGSVNWSANGSMNGSVTYNSNSNSNGNGNGLLSRFWDSPRGYLPPPIPTAHLLKSPAKRTNASGTQLVQVSGPDNFQVHRVSPSGNRDHPMFHSPRNSEITNQNSTISRNAENLSVSEMIIAVAEKLKHIESVTGSLPISENSHHPSGVCVVDFNGASLVLEYVEKEQQVRISFK